MLHTREQVVYIDILFVINLMINYMILLAVSHVLHRKDNRFRLFLGACIGAGYALMIFFPESNFLYTGALKLLVSVVIVAAAYRFRSPLALLKLVVCFYVISIVFGGMIFALWMFLSPPGLLVRNGIVYYDISPVMLVMASGGCYAAITLLARFIHRNSTASSICRAEITLGGVQIKTEALLDTGNNLCDMITGMPVVIAEYSAVEKLIPRALRNSFKSGVVGDGKIFENEGWSEKLRLIPYGSVGKSGGLLPAFRPDKLVVTGKSGKTETDFVLIAVTGRRLSGDGAYSALLNPSVFKEITV